MSRGADSGKIQEWTDRLERFEGSRLTVARYCEAERISEPSFYYWKKKLRDLSSSSRDVIVRRRESASEGGLQGSFQAVRISSPTSELAREATQQLAMTIHFGNEVRIELGDDLQVAEFVVKQVLDACSDSLRRAASPNGRVNESSSSAGAE